MIQTGPTETTRVAPPTPVVVDSQQPHRFFQLFPESDGTAEIAFCILLAPVYLVARLVKYLFFEENSSIPTGHKLPQKWSQDFSRAVENAVQAQSRGLTNEEIAELCSLINQVLDSVPDQVKYHPQVSDQLAQLFGFRDVLEARMDLADRIQALGNQNRDTAQTGAAAMAPAEEAEEVTLDILIEQLSDSEENAEDRIELAKRIVERAVPIMQDDDAHQEVKANLISIIASPSGYFDEGTPARIIGTNIAKLIAALRGMAQADAEIDDVAMRIAEAIRPTPEGEEPAPLVGALDSFQQAVVRGIRDGVIHMDAAIVRQILGQRRPRNANPAADPAADAAVGAQIARIYQMELEREERAITLEESDLTHAQQVLKNSLLPVLLSLSIERLFPLKEAIETCYGEATLEFFPRLLAANWIKQDIHPPVTDVSGTALTMLTKNFLFFSLLFTKEADVLALLLQQTEKTQTIEQIINETRTLSVFSTLQERIASLSEVKRSEIWKGVLPNLELFPADQIDLIAVNITKADRVLCSLFSSNAALKEFFASFINKPFSEAEFQTLTREQKDRLWDRVQNEFIIPGAIHGEINDFDELAFAQLIQICPTALARYRRLTRLRDVTVEGVQALKESKQEEPKHILKQAIGHVRVLLALTDTSISAPQAFTKAIDILVTYLNQGNRRFNLMMANIKPHEQISILDEGVKAIAALCNGNVPTTRQDLSTIMQRDGSHKALALINKCNIDLSNQLQLDKLFTLVQIELITQTIRSFLKSENMEPKKAAQTVIREILQPSARRNKDQKAAREFIDAFPKLLAHCPSLPKFATLQSEFGKVDGNIRNEFLKRLSDGEGVLSTWNRHDRQLFEAFQQIVKAASDDQHMLGIVFSNANLIS